MHGRSGDIYRNDSMKYLLFWCSDRSASSFFPFCNAPPTCHGGSVSVSSPSLETHMDNDLRKKAAEWQQKNRMLLAPGVDLHARKIKLLCPSGPSGKNKWEADRVLAQKAELWKPWGWERRPHFKSSSCDNEWCWWGCPLHYAQLCFPSGRGS